MAGKTTSSTYDYENRLTAMSYASGASSAFVYSGDNRRLSVTEGGVVTNYLYDGKLPIIERNSSNVTQNTYTEGIGYDGGIGGLISQTQLGVTGWYHYVHDGSGNVTDLSNASGVLLETYDYDAFGNIVAQSGTAVNVHQFQTKEADAASGLVYFGRRWYDPMIGRWTTADPLGMVDGPDEYLYVNNDPLNKSDYWGLCGGIDFVDGIQFNPDAAIAALSGPANSNSNSNSSSNSGGNIFTDFINMLNNASYATGAFFSAISGTTGNLASFSYSTAEVAEVSGAPLIAIGGVAAGDSLAMISGVTGALGDFFNGDTGGALTETASTIAGSTGGVGDSYISMAFSPPEAPF